MKGFAPAPFALVLVALAVGVPGSAGQDRERECGLVSPRFANGDVIAYQAIVERGPVECQEVERALTTYMEGAGPDPDPPGWNCRYTTGVTSWIVRCRGNGGIIRADWLDPTTVPVPKRCGTISARSGLLILRMRVRAIERMPCRRARRLIKSSVESGAAGVPAGWECVRGGASYPYSQGCGKRRQGILTLYAQGQTVGSRPLTRY